MFLIKFKENNKGYRYITSPIPIEIRKTSYDYIYSMKYSIYKIGEAGYLRNIKMTEKIQTKNKKFTYSPIRIVYGIRVYSVKFFVTWNNVYENR